MSEPRNPQPAKDGGLKTPPTPQASDAGLTKTGGETRGADGADDVERDDGPGRRDGGMIGEG